MCDTAIKIHSGNDKVLDTQCVLIVMTNSEPIGDEQHLHFNQRQFLPLVFELEAVSEANQDQFSFVFAW